jgi:hypothetical protein
MSKDQMILHEQSSPREADSCATCTTGGYNHAVNRRDFQLWRLLGKILSL